MAYSKTEMIAFELAKPIAEENLCFIYDIEFVKEGGLYYLRVYLDKEGGIDLDTCEVVSRALSEKLDITDPISQNYYLEVSSPGIERKLKTKEHFERYLGEVIDIGLYKSINGSKLLSGKLISYIDGVITVETADEIIGRIEINQKETTSVKLHFDF